MPNRIENPERDVTHPSALAREIYNKYQGIDNPASIREMIEEIRRLDCIDGRGAMGNGKHSPAIREAATICAENLLNPRISDETAAEILTNGIPAFSALVSGRFSDVIDSLRSAITFQTNAPDPAVRGIAVSALKKLNGASSSSTPPTPLGLQRPIQAVTTEPDR